MFYSLADQSHRKFDDADECALWFLCVDFSRPEVPLKGLWPGCMGRCDPTPCREHKHHLKQQMFLLLWAMLTLCQVLNATLKPHAELFGLVKRPHYECADIVHSALAKLLVRVRLLRQRIVASQVCLGHNGMQ